MRVASAARSLAYSRGREAGFRANLAGSGPSQPTPTDMKDTADHD